MQSYDPHNVLKAASSLRDSEFYPAEMLLAFSSLSREKSDAESYLYQLKRLSDRVLDGYQSLLSAGASDDAGSRLASLRQVLILDEGLEILPYDPGAEMNPHDLCLMDALDRGVLSVPLMAVLYADIAQRLEWDLSVLSIPKAYIMRLDFEGQRLLFDVAEPQILLNAPDIRQKIKASVGNNAELSSAYFDPVGVRDLVVDVQNRLKFYKIRIEDYAGALEIVQAMQLLLPEDFRLLLDAGVLYARLEQNEAARFALEHYIDKVPDPQSRAQARVLLDEISGR